MDVVRLEKVEKQIKKLPLHIKVKLLEWASAVEMEGLTNIRMIKGYHDEPLSGSRVGQRSIRLSKAYRAIYVESRDGNINIVDVVKVSKHEY